MTDEYVHRQLRLSMNEKSDRLGEAEKKLKAAKYELDKAWAEFVTAKNAFNYFSVTRGME